LTIRSESAHGHLEQGIALARRAEHARQAIELAQRHGWTDEPAFGVACRTLGATLAWQGRPEEAEPWILHGERTVTAEAEPAAAGGVCYARGVLELARGRDRDALAASLAAERVAGRLNVPNLVVPLARAMQMLILVRLGDIERAEQTLAALDERARERGDIRVETAVLLLAQHDPDAAVAVLAPVLDGTAPMAWPSWLIRAFLLEATARTAAARPSSPDRTPRGHARQHGTGAGTHPDPRRPPASSTTNARSSSGSHSRMSTGISIG
jgi:LuxR family transcriptional regulator, maltose regulon positive regulatory protein